jgi:hypothetical protein
LGSGLPGPGPGESPAVMEPGRKHLDKWWRPGSDQPRAGLGQHWTARNLLTMLAGVLEQCGAVRWRNIYYVFISKFLISSSQADIGRRQKPHRNTASFIYWRPDPTYGVEFNKYHLTNLDIFLI